jgi:hypothetical protein
VISLISLILLPVDYCRDNNDLYDDEPSSTRHYYRDSANDHSSVDRHGGRAGRYADDSPPARRKGREDSDGGWRDPGARAKQVRICCCAANPDMIHREKNIFWQTRFVSLTEHKQKAIVVHYNLLLTLNLKACFILFICLMEFVFATINCS